MVSEEVRVSPVESGDLYRQHANDLMRFATSLVGASDAADVIQDAVTSLISSGRLRDADNPRALLYRAVLTRAKMLHRSAFRRRHRERRFAESLVAVDPEFRPEIAAALAALSPQQRACVYFTYWEDMTPTQIGDRLGIAEGTVKAHLARARKRLRGVIHE